jgi:hypothetical protein
MEAKFLTAEPTRNGRRPAGVAIDPEWLQYQMDVRAWSMHHLSRESGTAEATIVKALRGARVRKDAVRRWIGIFKLVPPMEGMERMLKRVGMAPEDV